MQDQDKPRTNSPLLRGEGPSRRRLLSALGVVVAIALLGVAVVGCEPQKRAEDMPGPAGCGLRDPRDTSPGMLSLAQKRTLQDMGDPKEVARNELGGLDWKYTRKAGSVFGEEETLIIYKFDAQGLLKDTSKEMLRKVGK